MKKRLLVVLACIAISGCASVTPDQPARTDHNGQCADNVARYNCFKPIM